MRSHVLGLLLVFASTLILVLAPGVYAFPTVSFAKTCGGPNDDIGRGVVLEPITGDIYVAGYTGGLGSNPPAATSVLLLKYDSSGNVLWQAAWGGGSFDEVYKAVLDSHGNIYLVGATASFTGDLDTLVLKYNSSGVLDWARTWGKPGLANKDAGFGIAVSNTTGNIYVTGFTNSFGTGATKGATQLFLLKLDQAGNLQWQRIWNGTTLDWGFDVALNKFEQVYVAGYTNSFGAGSGDSLLLNFDPAGNLLDTATWGGTGFDQARTVAVDRYGNVYVAGRTTSVITGSSEAFLLKYTPTLFLKWQTAWGGVGDTEGAGLTIGGKYDNNTYVTGLTNSTGAGGEDVFLLKYDNLAGGLLLQNTWGGGKDDRGYSVAVTPTDAFVTGYVSEAPPYTLMTPSIASPATSLTTGSPVGTLYTPSGTMSSPSGVTTLPACSTTYLGGTDIFLLKLALVASSTSLNPLLALPILLAAAALRIMRARSSIRRVM